MAEDLDPYVRVVVLNWNSAWYTRRCLEALAATEYPADRVEVVLVDNGSVDGSLERLRDWFPDIRVVANGANLSIPLYVKRSTVTASSDGDSEVVSLRSAWEQWQTDGRLFWQQMDELVETLDGLNNQEEIDA